jgi:hypothetical protein
VFGEKIEKPEQEKKQIVRPVEPQKKPAEGLVGKLESQPVRESLKQPVEKPKLIQEIEEKPTIEPKKKSVAELIAEARGEEPLEKPTKEQPKSTEEEKEPIDIIEDIVEKEREKKSEE